MPQIFDNIQSNLIDGLRVLLEKAKSCAFCVGYFHLQGWENIADLIENLEGTENSCCRLLVGMHRAPEEEMRILQSARRQEIEFDAPTAKRFEEKVTQSFKEQLEFGIPSAKAERTLRTLARQLRAGKLRVKVFLRYPLHAKLYLIEREDPITPLIGFVGSSNLTLAGLSRQGELNVEVVDQDAARKLLHWFNERWEDRYAFDITEKLAELIENSWAGLTSIRPYLVYLKIAYHLCEEARQGEAEFRLPRVFQKELLDFQKKAVFLAAQHLHRRGGVLLGDVVGLGKTLMATAVAKIFQEDDSSNTLVICPPKLKPMWESYFERYQMLGRVLSIGKVIEELGKPDAPRYRTLIIDESHNLRNREGKRYGALRSYIERNEPRVILLSATPYNKHYSDLSNQLRLFLDENKDLHIRPERFFHKWYSEGRSEADFVSAYQISTHSLRAFEKSDFPEDWRDLMRLFLVRRTRQFIIRNYAEFDEEKQRYYVHLDGKPHYFPIRQPRTLTFSINSNDPDDQYARLLCEEVISIIESLQLPRYGLANYLVKDAEIKANSEQKKILDNLNRSGRRLIGVCRTNLFKRLESDGYSFLLSIKRHILRNLITHHALENGLPVPIGTQDVAMLDELVSDADEEFVDVEDDLEIETNKGVGELSNDALSDEMLKTISDDSLNLYSYLQRAAGFYEKYQKQFKSRFKWLDAKFFTDELSKHLLSDALQLLSVLQRAGKWQAEKDTKLNLLHEVLTKTHPKDKVLIFTQFADTALYLNKELKNLGFMDCDVVTSQTADPFSLARRFSPNTNGGLRVGETELRVLIATDVLAEGQNLQDAHIIINFDLPWAIIRLIQRAGRVDRIGQKHDTITVYSFLPDDGVERIIGLRRRLSQRLQINQEVLGSDESFFGEEAATKLYDLYTEKAGVLDDDSSDEDIDLASLALQVWNSASKADQDAAKKIPPIAYSAKALRDESQPSGVISYVRFPDGMDALVRVDESGNVVSQSFSAIFSAAACGPDTPAVKPFDNHHELVERCVEFTIKDESYTAGALGSLRSTSRKVYDRLVAMRERYKVQPPLFGDFTNSLDQVISILRKYPLKESAREALSRQIRLGIKDEDLARMVIEMANENKLCEIREEEKLKQEPQVICSLGLIREKEYLTPDAKS